MGADELRATLVDSLLDDARIRTPAVERAFRSVPRHLFLPDTPLDQAYLDEAVATKWQDGVAISSASQPSMMAIMLEQLELRPGHRVLEIGTGTGYNAALMAQIVGPTGSVAAVDIDDDLTESAVAHLRAAGAPLSDGGGRGITLATRDGALGYAELAPYDRIVLTVGSWDIQPAWWGQLAPRGRLLLPLSIRGSHLSVAFDLLEGPAVVLQSVSVRSCAFVRLRGLGVGPESTCAVADGLTVQTRDGRELDQEGLEKMLDEPGPERRTPARLSVVDLWDGFGLWLAVYEPDACRLLVCATSTRYRSLSLLPAGPDGGTMALVGDDGLAVLVAPGASSEPSSSSGRFPVAVRPCGPGGEALADTLAVRLREWADAGRPAALDLRLRVQPDPGSSVEPTTDAATLHKGHTWLELEWPGVRAPVRPKLRR